MLNHFLVRDNIRLSNTLLTEVSFDVIFKIDKSVELAAGGSALGAFHASFGASLVASFAFDFCMACFAN